MATDQITASLDIGDLSNLEKAMLKAQSVMGKSASDALRWGAWTLANSLSGSTKASAKLRPVIRNPDKSAKTDARKALYGVNMYGRKGKHFVPIRGTGEFGKIRYIDKKTMQVMTRDRATGEVRRENFSTSDPGAEGIGIMNHKKRKIGRRGLAKLAWVRGMGAIGRANGAFQVGPGVVGLANRAMTVSKRFTGVDQFVQFNNQLRYAGLAFRTKGRRIVSETAERAADGMMHKIDKAAEKIAGRAR